MQAEVEQVMARGAHIRQAESYAADHAEISENHIPKLHRLVMVRGDIRHKTTPYRDAQNLGDYHRSTSETSR